MSLENIDTCDGETNLPTHWYLTDLGSSLVDAAIGTASDRRSYMPVKEQRRDYGHSDCAWLHRTATITTEVGRLLVRERESLAWLLKQSKRRTRLTSTAIRRFGR